MANTDVYLNVVGGTATLQDSSGKNIGKVTLEFGDTMTLHVGSGFSGTTSLSNVGVYAWNAGVKGDLLGNWPASNDVGVLSIATSGSNVVVTDGDQGSTDGDYGYSVTATSVRDGVTSFYTADPELLAKKKRGTSRRAADAMRRTARPPDAEV